MSYGKIILSSFSVLNSTDLDQSDFILISVKILEKLLKENPALPDFIQEVQQDYFKQNYHEAIDKIIDFCRKNESTLGIATIERLEQISSKLISNPKKNESRRLYETVYADHLESSVATETDISIFNKLRDSYNSVKPEYAETRLSDITSLDEAKDLILSFLILNDNVELYLKAGSDLYRKKDRSRDELEDVYTANPGIIKPNSPNFPDNIVSPHKIANIEINERIKEGYSKIEPSTPFVASISGTTYSFIVILQHYIDSHKDEPTLQQDVNAFVNLWISTYIKVGYHSYREVVDVFQEPSIQSIFEKANIKLNYGLLEDTKDEFQKAQHYAFGIASRSLMHKELLQKFKVNQDIQDKHNNLIGKLTENGSQYLTEISDVDALFKSWVAGEKEYREYQSKCNELFNLIDTNQQKSSYSFGSVMRGLGNWIVYIVTFKFMTEASKPSFALESSKQPVDINALKIDLRELDELVKDQRSSQRKSVDSKSKIEPISEPQSERVDQKDEIENDDISTRYTR